MVAMGHEGRAASLYWSAIAALVPTELAFPGRRTRGAEDPINQCLNYAYGCLYAEVWRALARAGLDPSFGIVHGSDREAVSLVFDVIEELRAPFGDRLVLSLIGRGFRPRLSRRGTLASSSRRTIARAFARSAARPVKWRSRRQSLSRLIEGQADALRRLFHGEEAGYHAFHLRW